MTSKDTVPAAEDVPPAQTRTHGEDNAGTAGGQPSGTDGARMAPEGTALTTQGPLVTPQTAGPPPFPSEEDPGPVRRTSARRPLMETPFVRAGVYGWAFVGILVLLFAAGWAMQRLSLIVIPLVLALFPTAVLAPPTAALKRHLPNALAALLVILGVLGLLAGTVAVFIEPVSNEIGGITESAAEGAATVQEFLEDGPFGLAPVPVDALIEEGRARLQEQGAELTSSAISAAGTIAQGVTGLVFMFVALFFYLKDGPVIARWVPTLFPTRFREDVQQIGLLTWQTVGAYIRGQLFVAFVDGLFIGLGLWILGVPLALPLGVLVFFFSLFPVVGAIVSGAIATLVALATNGLTTALLVLVVVIVVQQVESNVLAPVVLGRATALHPLATIVSLAAGAILLGILGAFIAVPIVASVARAVQYLRTRPAT